MDISISKSTACGGQNPTQSTAPPCHPAALPAQSLAHFINTALLLLTPTRVNLSKHYPTRKLRVYAYVCACMRVYAYVCVRMRVYACVCERIIASFPLPIRLLLVLFSLACLAEFVQSSSLAMHASVCDMADRSIAANDANRPLLSEAGAGKGWCVWCGRCCQSIYIYTVPSLALDETRNRLLVVGDPLTQSSLQSAAPTQQSHTSLGSLFRWITGLASSACSIASNFPLLDC